jgi:hypothetical protein
MSFLYVFIRCPTLGVEWEKGMGREGGGGREGEGGKGREREKVKKMKAMFS